MENVKRFCTKYWETRGIEELTGEETRGYFYVNGRYGSTQFTEGKDAFETRADAITNVRKRALAKIKSLDKARAKVLSILEKL